MRIIAADIIDVDLHRFKPPIILKLITDEGIYGLGEFALAYGTGRRAAIGMLQDMLEECVLGADPLRIEQMWHTLFRRTFWGQGGGTVVYGGMSTIDMALWDIKGKALGQPIYELLGGKTRDEVRVYANGWYGDEWKHNKGWSPVTPQEFARAAAQVVELGYDALKFNPFGSPPGGKLGQHERLLEPERADLGYARVAAVREAVGPQVDIMVECHGWFGVTSAIEMGRRLEELHPFFYEEPVDAMNVECMRKVAENVRIPIAAGERLYTRYGFREYIEGQVLDVLQPDVGLAGGITELKKIAAYAETHDLHIQPHNCHGPIATAAAVQVDACITNFIIQETVGDRPDITYDVVNEPLEKQIKLSRMPVPTSPGLGVTLNEEVVGRCPRIHLGR
ncbi:MAG: mandelate racemase/muconate lactonizing enzyme family protein [Chloroflexi bacterium]|nr:mandelate racemase/muconate lactonizing enzyme family protein [Chloroflexota bacterium]